MDLQLKIRGFRVEPGEIEVALSEHPGVREVVVTPWSDSSGSRRLVAYLVPEPGWRVDALQLRGFLKERVPDFMVPAAFVALDALPRLPHGKVSLQALPAPVFALIVMTSRASVADAKTRPIAATAITPWTPGAGIVLRILRVRTSKASNWLAFMCEIHSSLVLGSRLV